MANIKPVYGTLTTQLSTELDNLTGGGSATGSERDNTSDRFMDLEVAAELISSAADTGYCSIYIIEGVETGKLATTANVSNMRHVMDIQMNGGTAVRKTRTVERVKPFYKLHIIKNASPALAGNGSTIKTRGVNYENI